VHSLAERRSTVDLPSDQDASGRNLGLHEIELLREAVLSGTLTSTKGRFVRTLQRRFADTLGVDHGFGCASGTAAIHCAIAAIDPEPGDEIITSPITDMGALAPIVYQGAIPVFADVDPATCNLTAATIQARISERTRAIIVTHLFGNPCDMKPIMALARACEIPVIEDCAQAFLASDHGSLVGTIGAIGCFSLQQGKHITTGEGGLVVTSDAALARRMELFINKAWGYGDPDPDHYFLALNYRMSELQGAVGLAQLDGLENVVRRRIALADRLTAMLARVRGITPPVVRPQSRHVYWKYCLRADAPHWEGGVTALAGALRERGIAAVPRYIQKPAFACAVFRDRKTFGQSGFPFSLARPEALDYDRSRFPGTYAALDGIVVIPWNDRYTDDHVELIADSVVDAVQALEGARA